MVVGNTLSEIGDVLVVDTQLSIMGNTVQLVSFTDSTLGVTPTRFFNKKFRVSQDGLLYTQWNDLTVANISQIQGNIINNILYIQYRFERAGTDTTGLLEFVSINVTGNVVPTTCTSPVTDNSIFKGLSCGNFVTTQLCSNLLKKLYKNGIIPEYISRGINHEDDEDYIAYWSAIACYMSMFVTFMMRFENIYMDRELLIEYLKQLNMYNCDWETTTADLQYVVSHYYDEIRKRGTKQVFLRKNEVLQDGNNVPIDGEILRLVCADECDEFLWTLREINHVGWNVGNSSPLFKGTAFEQNLIKGFEKTKECLDLTKYQTFGSFIDNIGGTINIAGTASQLSGLGYQNFNTQNFVSQKGIVVNPNLDYEITFMIKVKDVSSNPKFDFGCHAYDCNDNKYALRTIDFNNITDMFKVGAKIHKAGDYYFVRGIVYSVNQQPIASPDCMLNIASGVNLKFDNPNTNMIMPYIRVYCGDDANIFSIYDFKVRPLRYNHSIGFLNTNNVVEIFAENKNKKHTVTEIYEIIRRDLIPYNTVLILNDISGNGQKEKYFKWVKNTSGITYYTRIYKKGFSSSAINQNTPPASNVEAQISTLGQWKSTPSAEGPSVRNCIWPDVNQDNIPDIVSSGNQIIVNFDVNYKSDNVLYLGFNCKSGFEIYVNNTLVAIQQNSGSWSRDLYHILPVNVVQGSNNFRIVAKSTGNISDSVTAVVYDNTVQELIAATDDSDLNILFRTTDLVK